MIECLAKIDEFLNTDESNFWTFYNWFQDWYFGDKNEKIRKSLRPDEIAVTHEINELLAYAGTNPTQQERDEGIMDENQFRERLSKLKKENVQIWNRYGM